MPAHGLLGVPDAGAFLARLIRFDPAAAVRLRSSGDRTALWAQLPWNVLVTREVAGPGPGDATVAAAELLRALAQGDDTLPARRDAQWRWPLPPPGVRVVENVAVAEVSRLASAAAGTLRDVTAGGLGGRAVGQRVVRDALLDHVALVVTPSGGSPVNIPQRLVQAVARMGFLGPTGDSSPAAGDSSPAVVNSGPVAAGHPAGVDSAHVRVCVSGRWVGISAPYGVGWLPAVQELTVMPITGHLNG
jgi:hypothetical protein